MENWQEHAGKIYRYLCKILVVLLLGLGLWELYEGIHFFVVVLPHLEESLAAHTLSSNEMQDVSAEAIASTVDSFINMFFAVRVYKTHSKLIELFDFVAGSSLVVWHHSVVEWLSLINYVALWERFW